MRVLRAIPVVAALLLGCGGSEPAEPNNQAAPSVPASMQLLAGVNNQSAAVASQLPTAITVRVLDAKAAPVPAQVVNFVVTKGGGSVFAGASQTNSSGEAADYWTLGTTAGAQELQIRAIDPATQAPLVVATVKATAMPGAVDTVNWRVRRAFSVRGGSYPMAAMMDYAADQYGNPVATYSPSVTAAGGWSYGNGMLTAPAQESSVVLQVQVGNYSDSILATSALDLRSENWTATWGCNRKGFDRDSLGVFIDSITYHAVIDSVVYDTYAGGLDEGYGYFYWTATTMSWKENGVVDTLQGVQDRKGFRQAKDSVVVASAPGVDDRDRGLLSTSLSTYIAGLLVSTSPPEYSGGDWCRFGYRLQDRTATLTAQ